MSESIEQQLREAFTLMKEGDKKEAGRIVQGVIKQDKDNIKAWWMMANLLQDENRIIKCLDKVLELDSEHPGANRMMRKLNPEHLGMDWSKIGGGEIDLENKGPAKDEVRMATYGLLGIAAIGALAVILAILIPFIQSLGPTPDKAVQDYLDAIGRLDFQAAADLTCAQYRYELIAAQEELDALLAMVPEGEMSMDDFSFDFSQLSINVLNNDGNRAVVELTGDITMTIPSIGGVSSSMTFNMEDMASEIGEQAGIQGISPTVQMVNENGQWLACSSMQAP